ncbi:response regulator transcription factor [Kineococcus sp. NBC_00420]|uniref:response regulator transcription factor n=1 Tax=unclassified Kineococcus TaxID=2621656 RepID=UPI002E1A8A94
MSRVLVVEDEPGLRRTLDIHLSARGWDVSTAADGRTALTLAEREPDVVLLDLGLPDMDGLEVLSRLRERGRTPVVVLTARTSTADTVAALDAGADDYVTKPFSFEVLIARLRAATRRDARPVRQHTLFEAGALRIDLDAPSVTRHGATVKLTPIEWRLLRVLLGQAGRLVGQQRLLSEVWGPTYGHQTNYLRVYLAQMRRKLEDDPARPRHLITEPGMGYRFDP